MQENEQVNEQPVEQPVQEAPQEQAQTTESTLQEQPIETTEAPAESTESVESTPVETEDDEPIEDMIDWTQFLTPESEPTVPQADENGVDPEQYAQWILAQNRRQTLETIKFAESERKMYRDIEKQYPEFKTNAKVRTTLHNLRIADVAQGGKGDLKAIAKDFFGEIYTNAKNEGKAAAQTSVSVQQTASLASSGPATLSANDSEIMNKLTSKNHVEAKEARLSLLEQMIKDGKL